MSSRDSDSAAPEQLSVDAAGDEVADDAERWRDRVDLGALLAALVLVPYSYPRNRFFSLYCVPEARVVRRRAARLRSVASDLATVAADVAVRREGEEVVLSYRLDELGARRAVMLTEDEFALIRVALQRKDSRRCHVLGDADPGALGRIAPLLRRLFDEPESS